MSSIVLSRKHLFTFLVLSTFSIFLLPEAVKAACSPGIPCTTYDIYSNTTSGTDAAFNGPKVDDATAPHNESACDGNFMNQIYARAHLEASREVIMGQQLIHKPDSVLEYTCFDQILNHSAENGNSFSSSTTFDSRPICIETADTACITTNLTTPVSGTEVADALGIFLYDVMQVYVNSNFAHTFMGEATTIDNDIAATGSAAPYGCSHMATVWEIEKCTDFAEDDRFRTFEELIAADPRSIPVACSPANIASDSVEAGSDPTKLDSTSAALPDLTPAALANNAGDPCPAAGTPVAGVNTGLSNDLVRVANNCDLSNTERNAYASVDLMESYDEYIRGIGLYLPGTGTATGILFGGSFPSFFCMNPIPTGVPVISYDYDAPGAASDFSGPGTGPGGMHEIDRTTYIHYDHICPNPGCFYQAVRVPYLEGAAFTIPVVWTTPLGVCVPY